jgi:hypothetical protein
MDQVPQRLWRWFRAQDDQTRRHASVLVALGAAYLGHYLVYCTAQPFYIEDAGISFAYARNFVDGEGFATFPGGERVEGYSNALWTFLVAAFYGLGVSPWVSSKIMGAVFGLMTLPLAYDITRRARPGRDADIALLTPLMLAASPQFVIWNASGLENALFCLLLAAGMRSVLVESEKPEAPPLSALCFFGLSMTRPEGLAYGGIGFFALAVAHLRQRRFAPLLRWGLAAALPWLAYNAWRYAYFAWPFPNTYYAKLEVANVFKPYAWTRGGWKYIQNWFVQHGVIYVLPLFPLAMTGLRRRARWVSAAVIALVALVLLWDGRAGLPIVPDAWRTVQGKWVELRVWTIGLSAAALGLCAFTRSGWQARGMMWASAVFGLFFALYSDGDWMKGHRWFNLITVPLFGLLTLGVAELVDLLAPEGRDVALPARLRDRLPLRLQGGPVPRLILMAPFALAWVGVEAWRSTEWAQNPETAVRDVHRRVTYMSWVQRRLDVDHITLLDVDMGAHMYFSGWRIVDIAGLVDVPIARNRDYPKRFLQQYIFEENNPEFGHVHGGWARSSKIADQPEWKERYLEIPGYPSGGRQLHVGNHVRKDLFIQKVTVQPGPDATRFETGVTLTRLAVPAPKVAPGGVLFVDTALRATARKDGFRLLFVLDDGAGHRTVQAVGPGYDWYRPEQWKRTEEVQGRFRLNLPDDLPLGTYQLTMVLLDEKTGAVLKKVLPEAPPAEPTVDGAAPPAPPAAPPPIFLEGEHPTGLSVELVSVEAAHEAADARQAEAIALAESPDRCEEAWSTWKDASRHVLRDEAWVERQGKAMRGTVAGCYLRRAEQAADDAARIAALIEARRWDHHIPGLVEAAEPLADAAVARGEAAAAEEAWEEAYAAFSEALRLDPSRSWARRHAETARDHVLGIAPAEDDEEADEAEAPAEVGGDG